MKRYVHYNETSHGSDITLGQLISVMLDREMISILAGRNLLYSGSVGDFFARSTSDFITTYNFNEDELDGILQSRVNNVHCSNLGCNIQVS